MSVHVTVPAQNRVYSKGPKSQVQYSLVPIPPSFYPIPVPMLSLSHTSLRPSKAAICLLNRSACRGLRYSSNSPKPYTFHVAASWAGKPVANIDRVPWPKKSPIRNWRDGMLRTHSSSPDPEDPGEDFFFIQQMRKNSGVAFGVADGVGGWADSGVDPALFSQALMFHADQQFRDSWPGEPEHDPVLEHSGTELVLGRELTPYDCLAGAYDGVLREKYVEAGSSTACLLTINASSGLLRSANLGDSGYLIIRNSQVIYQQASQTHEFNCPKQLSKYPYQKRRYWGNIMDKPSAAAPYETRLRDGDIVMAYTDGLADNVYPVELASIASLIRRQEGMDDEHLLVQTIADRVVDYARACMQDRRRLTPFARESIKAGLYWLGGKVDDVTVVTCLVRETQ